jgi:GT2 family glycosyltransferase
VSQNASDVSVIVPTFNRSAMLKQCLASLLAQTRPPLEIIVVDDGSTDSTERVVGAMEPPVRYLRKANGGKASALNLALPSARGRWIWFFDDDDLALPDSIERRLAAAMRVPDARLVISRFVWGHDDGSGNVIAGDELAWPKFDATDFYVQFLRSCFAHLNGALIRRDRAEEAGPFRTDLLTSEDYDYTLRVARGEAIAICDAPTFIFRQHAEERGPSGKRYAAAERVRKFAVGDAEIGRWIRSTHSLAEYIGQPADRDLDAEARRQALFARMQVMAGKGLFREFADDALAFARETDRTGGRLDSHAIHDLRVACQGSYLTLAACRPDADAVGALAPLATTQTGRAMLRAIPRALAAAVRRHKLAVPERARLAAVALRLALLARTRRSATPPVPLA